MGPGPSDELKPDSVVRDLALMEQLRAGETAALDELLRHYWAPVVRYVERLLDSVDAAEDIAQQVFVQLWERRASWVVGGSVATYLFRAARNLAYNETRNQSVRARRGGVFRQQDQRRPVRPDQVMEGNELEAAVKSAIASLPERRREVFVLVRFHGLSYRQVAEVMGISVQTVANQLSAAVADLRRELALHLDETPSVPLRPIPFPSSSLPESAAEGS